MLFAILKFYILLYLVDCQTAASLENKKQFHLGRPGTSYLTSGVMLCNSIDVTLYARILVSL